MNTTTAERGQIMAGVNGSRRVLIVDPDPAHCAMLERGLVRLDCVVYVSHDGRSALAVAQGTSVDYAVVELQLPDHSGLKLVERLKASNGELKIVVLASTPSIATAVEAIKLGATHYLPKPVFPEEVVAAFDRCNGDATIAVNAPPLSLDAFLWERIDRALLENGGNVSAAARALDMHRRTLQRKLRQRSRGGMRDARVSAPLALQRPAELEPV